jgi:hypothetical protein
MRKLGLENEAIDDREPILAAPDSIENLLVLHVLRDRLDVERTHFRNPSQERLIMAARLPRMDGAAPKLVDARDLVDSSRPSHHDLVDEEIRSAEGE